MAANSSITKLLVSPQNNFYFDMNSPKAKTYRSRISLKLITFIIIPLFFPILFLPEGEKLKYLAVTSPIFIFLIVCFYSIKYVIDGEKLKIYSFGIKIQIININDITKMEPSNCIISSPAASLKRLAIHYGKRKVVYISPRNQDDFIQAINAAKI